MTLIEKFWSLVDVRGPDECWPWKGPRDPNGYGRLHHKGKRHLAHRISLSLWLGKPLSRLCSLHTCDSPPCSNPAHLFPGTRGDNSQDAARKGRNHWQRQTRCKNGHPFDRVIGKQRACSICRRAAYRRWYRRHRVQAT